MAKDRSTPSWRSALSLVSPGHPHGRRADLVDEVAAQGEAVEVEAVEGEAVEGALTPRPCLRSGMQMVTANSLAKKSPSGCANVSMPLTPTRTEP